MKTFSALLSIAILGALSASAEAQGYRDATAKAHGQFGGSSRSYASRSMRSYPAPSYATPSNAYQAPPMVAQSMPASGGLGQMPNERQSLSVDPSQGAAMSSGCNVQSAPLATGEIASAPRTVRSFSVDPSTPVYSGPSMRRGSSASSPSYLLPRSDLQKHSGR